MIWPSALVFTFTSFGLSFIINDHSWFTQIGCAMLGVVAALFWARGEQNTSNKPDSKCPRCGVAFALGGAHGRGFCIDRQGIDIPCEDCLDPLSCAEDICPETAARA